LLVVLGIVLSRVDGVRQDTNRQAMKTVGVHFVAGIAMLQAENRARKSMNLNELGYPTGNDGRLSSHEDCQRVWSKVMQTTIDEQHIAAVFVSDADGSGDRCEYLLAEPDPANDARRLLYWPRGSGAGVVKVDNRLLEVELGQHVHVDMGAAST